MPHSFQVQLLQFRFYDEDTVRCVGIVVKVILVIVLSLVEMIKRLGFGNDGIVEILLRFPFRSLRSELLLLVVVEDDGAILRADIRSLTI